MPFKPSPVSPDFSSLIVSLDNSKMQVKNYSLYQTIFFLIKNTAKARDLLQAAVKDIDEQIADAIAGSFLTVDDDTAIFPNSRQLLAGLGITFDDTVSGKRTISAVSGGSNFFNAPVPVFGSEQEEWTEPLFVPGTGAVGATGPAGATGAQGNQGPPGLDGECEYCEPLMIPGPKGDTGSGGGGDGYPSQLGYASL